MFLLVSLAAAIVGVALAGTAAFGPDTGIDGTLGAFLALMGAIAVALSLTVVWTERFPARVQAFFGWCAAVLAILTGLAAWFLMQDALFLAMVVSFSALLIDVAQQPRKTIH